MRKRHLIFPLFLLAIFSFLLAACASAPGSAAAPGDPAGLRAAAPVGGQPAATEVPATTLVAAAETGPADAAPAPAVEAVDPATTAAEPAALHQSAPLVASADGLSEAEVALLGTLRQEEKLAHDLYAVFYETWGLPIFDNIRASEAQHVASVLSVFEAYGLADPAAGLAAGQFASADLQALYDELAAQGARSPAEALLAAGLVEELDVADLEQALTQTGNPDLEQLLANLRLGSANHLLAFGSNYERQTGAAYTPQQLTAEAYDALLAQAAARRGGNGGGQGTGGGGQAGGEGTGQQGGTGRGGGSGNGYRGGRGQ